MHHALQPFNSAKSIAHTPQHADYQPYTPKYKSYTVQKSAYYSPKYMHFFCFLQKRPLYLPPKNNIIDHMVGVSFRYHCNTWHCFWQWGLAMRRFIIHSEDDLFRALLRAVLAPGGIEVIEASSRHELKKRCLSERFDRVITDDVRMFMNGSNITEQIRINNERAHIFILSTDISEHSVLSLLEEGVTEFLSLPIHFERLQKKLLK